MQRSKNSFLYHCHQMRVALAAAGAEAMLPFDSFDVLARREGAHHRFHPRFLRTDDGRRSYVASMDGEVDQFIGWLPYQRKNWLIAVDKLAFKQFARQADLLTPDYSFMADSALRNVIVKRASSSFGGGIHGPFAQAGMYRLDMLAGEFYERFTQGAIVKAWIWNGEPVCMERESMPTVTGDGKSTMAQLVWRRAARGRRLDDDERARLLGLCRDMLQYQEVSTDTVLPTGKRIAIEFRYGSDFLATSERRTIDFTRRPEHRLLTPLRTAAKRMEQEIPAAMRRDTLFTIDAIVDAQQQLWFLEMNCNPVVHPLVYGPIVQSVVGAASRPAASIG